MTGIRFELYTVVETAADLQLPGLRLLATDVGDAAFTQVLGLDLIATGAGTAAGHASIVLPPLSALASDQAAIALLRLPEVGVSAAATAIAPAVGTALLLALNLQVAGSSKTTMRGDVGQAVPLALLASDQASVGVMHMPPLRLYARDVAPTISKLAALVPAAGAMVITAGMAPAPATLIIERLGLIGAPDAEWVHALSEALGLQGQPVSLLDALTVAGDRLGFDDVIVLAWQLLAAESLQLSGAGGLSGLQVLQVVDLLTLMAGQDTSLAALTATQDALGLMAEHAFVVPAAGGDVVALGGALESALLASVREEQLLGMADHAAGYATITAVASEDLPITDGMTAAAILQELIREGLPLLLRVSLPGGEYLAWVCNAESRGFTAYRNFPFNSFCEIGGHYYGATDEGVYLLEGDDDAGEPIDARLRTGLMDMGTGLLKRMDAMYLGYRADGDLVLKVVTTSGDGEKRECWYPLERRPAGDMREGRVRIGKGLRSLYWGFEIANVDGADFALDVVRFLPLITERRV